MKPIFSFGKKKKRSSAKSKKLSKLPKKLLYICKKLKVKTKSSNGKYKSVKTLKASCLKRIKILKKKMLKKVGKRKVGKRKVGKRKVGNRRVTRRKGKVYRFGQVGPYIRDDPSNGYSGNSSSYPGVLPVTSQMDPSKGIYGINKRFFDESVPGVLPPEWYGNYQPDGSYIPTGYPFEAYPNFGKKRKSMRKNLKRRY